MINYRVKLYQNLTHSLQVTVNFLSKVESQDHISCKFNGIKGWRQNIFVAIYINFWSDVFQSHTDRHTQTDTNSNNTLHCVHGSQPTIFTQTVFANGLVVCNVCAPYSGVWNFPQYFFATLYLSHPLISTQNCYGDCARGTPLNAKGVAKCRVRFSSPNVVFGYLIS